MNEEYTEWDLMRHYERLLRQYYRDEAREEINRMGRRGVSFNKLGSEESDQKYIKHWSREDEFDNEVMASTECAKFGDKALDLSLGQRIIEETDPNGIDQHESGAKLDSGKPDASLLGMFGRALLAVSMVGTHGATKYSRGGWQEVPEGFNRYTAAMLRHYFKEETEGLWDDDLPETLHSAQVAWNALARLELQLRGLEKDHEN
jgi:hypothetical protein